MTADKSGFPEKNMKVLIIIPAYNEQDTILGVIRSLEDTGLGYDYLVINDCSRDNTPGILKSAGANYLSNPVNLGIGGAVQAGYRYACDHGYDIAVQMDGDGQHDPAYLPDLIGPILRGQADIVIGSRFIRKEGFQSSPMRRMGIGWLSFLVRLFTGTTVTDVTSGFRAVSGKYIALYARDYAQDYPEPEAIVTGAGRGAVIMEVPVIMNERRGGKSSIGGLKSLYYMIKVSMAIILTGMSEGHAERKREGDGARR